MKILIVGDAFVTKERFEERKSRLTQIGHQVDVVHWGPNDRGTLENIIREMEKGNIKDDSSLDSVKRSLEGKDALFVDFCPIPASIVEKVKFIGVSRLGVSNVDLNAVRKHRVPVVNISGRNKVAVAEFTIALILNLSRNIAFAHHFLMQGDWRKNFAYQPVELEGKRVGLLGYGEIGQCVARKLSGFGCETVFYDPYYKKISEYAISAELDELLKTSDFVSVHVGSSDSTRNMIGERELSLMKASAFLINTARADIVNLRALTTALKQRLINGAALDVFVEEPLPKDCELLTLGNIILTSHLAGSTPESMDKSVDLLFDSFIAYENGAHDRQVVKFDQ